MDREPCPALDKVAITCGKIQSHGLGFSGCEVWVHDAMVWCVKRLASRTNLQWSQWGSLEIGRDKERDLKHMEHTPQPAPMLLLLLLLVLGETLSMITWHSSANYIHFQKK